MTTRHQCYNSFAIDSKTEVNGEVDYVQISTAGWNNRNGDVNLCLQQEKQQLQPAKQRQTQTLRRKFGDVGTLAVLACLAVFSLFFCWHYLPVSTQEYEVIKTFNMPVIGSASRIRNAQDLADAYKHHFLESNQLKKALDKVEGRSKTHEKNHHSKSKLHEGCEATVVILRHCEKGSIREHCNYAGFERSVYLATLFGNDNNERWPAPTFIFAQSPGGRHRKSKLNFREIETVGPLSKKSGVSVDYSYNNKSINDLAKEIQSYLHTGALCGQVVLVVWQHSMIGHLAHHLGCGPVQGCPIDYPGRYYDEAWQIKYVYEGEKYSSQKSLKHKYKQKPQWNIYGSVQQENFDPLAFSKLVGDYSTNDKNRKKSRKRSNKSKITTTSSKSSHGNGDSEILDSSDITAAHWQEAAVYVPERSEPTDQKAWKALQLGMWPGQLDQEKERPN